MALVLLIVGAYFLYNKLSEENSGAGLVVDMTQNAQSQSNDSTNTATTSNNSNPAPDFTVIDNDSNSVKLSDMRGKPVVVNFWASWCPPCKAEMPDFEDMYKKYGDDIEFMMINLTDGYQETLSKAKAHISETGYTFPVYFDTRSSAAFAYGVSSIPATYFIDAEGNVVAHQIGMLNGETLEYGIQLIK